MISNETSYLIGNLFFQLFKEQKIMEYKRIALSELDIFDGYLIFQHIDKERKNYINDYNIAEFLK